MAVVPFCPIVYDNRTSFATVTPLQPAIPWIRTCDALAWSTQVYGWYDTMRIHLPAVPVQVGHWFLDTLLGRLTRLKAYGGMLWEGMVWEVSAAMPGATLTRSLSDMANKVYVEYSDELTNSNTASTASEDATSQALYGVKEFYVPAGGKSGTNAGNLAARWLVSHKYPPTTREITDRGPGLAEITIDCRGYYYTLAWKYYTATTTGTQDSSLTINDINTSAGAFIASTSLATTGRTSPRHFSQRQTGWEQMQGLVGLGTSNDLKYFMGVKNGRVLTGWEEPTTLSYIKNPNIPGRYFDATGGFPLQFWQVEPGKWVRVQLAASDNQQVTDENPRAMLIGSCAYDAVARTVKPSYDIKVPAIQSKQASAASTYDPFSAPWSTWEWKQGWRDIWINGKWTKQTTGWYSRENNPHWRG
jgi:hypothetical protein